MDENYVKAEGKTAYKILQKTHPNLVAELDAAFMDAEEFDEANFLDALIQETSLYLIETSSYAKPKTNKRKKGQQNKARGSG